MERQAKRDYDNERRAHRRKILKAMLGGECARCGTTEELQFDHIDPATKLFDISHGILKPWLALIDEAWKCQLLCPPCHRLKGAEQGDDRSVEHGGGLTGKRNCYCVLCKPLKTAYMKTWIKAG